MRKLVTIRKIAAIDPIPKADAIEVATVDGWKVVVKKNQFKVGDIVAYFEIDSFLPDGFAPWQFLVDKSSRQFEGMKGHVLRTVTLRGQLSQGLILSLVEIDAALESKTQEEDPESMPSSRLARFANVGDDITDALGVKKWEPQIPAQLAGLAKGYFPGWMRKTDQERCQNLITEIFVDNADAEYEVSLKMDGTSVTYYHRNGEIGACSRNLELKLCPENAENAIVKMMFESGLAAALPALGNVAIQGELMGPGIQENRERFTTTKFFIFDVQNLDDGTYFTAEQRSEFIQVLRTKGVTELIQHVPVLHARVKLIDLGIANVEQLLKYAEGPSLVNAVREGLVFKRCDGKFSFKAISNVYLQE